MTDDPCTHPLDGLVGILGLGDMLCTHCGKQLHAAQVLARQARDAQHQAFARVASCVQAAATR